MRIRKLLIIGVTLLFALCLVTACGSNQEQPETTPNDLGEVQTDTNMNESTNGQDVVNPVAGGNGYITITYGDGNLSVYDNALPLHNEYGFPGTNYVITSVVGTEGKMTVSHLQEMEVAGWETGSHSVNHEGFDTISEEQAEEEIIASAEWLEEQGLMHNSFSYPRGFVALEDVVKDNYDMAVLNGNSLNFAPVDKHKLVRVLFSGDNADQVLNLADIAAERNAWLIVYTHSVYPDTETPDEISVNVSDLESLFNKIQTLNMQAVTLTEGAEIMWQIPKD